jgi:hypothetical protein
MDWVKKRLKYPGQVSKSTEYVHAPSFEILDIRNTYSPKGYDQSKPQVRYQQVFEDRIGFKPNLCILDFLFCNGPASKSILSGL